jgi:hypothetical protein
MFKPVSVFELICRQEYQPLALLLQEMILGWLSHINYKLLELEQLGILMKNVLKSIKKEKEQNVSYLIEK